MPISSSSDALTRNARYLARLPQKEGLLAEMVRADAYDFRETLASFRNAKRRGFSSICLERFMGDARGFEEAVREVLAALGLGLDPAAFADLREAAGDHATGLRRRGIVLPALPRRASRDSFCLVQL